MTKPVPKQSTPRAKSGPVDDGFARHAVAAITIGAAAVAAFLVLWYAAQIFLAFFAGILLAVLLRTLASWVSEHARIPKGWSLTLVVVLLAGLLTGAGAWQGPVLADQFWELRKQVPAAADQLQRRLAQSSIGRPLLEVLPEEIRQGQVVDTATGIASGTVTVVAGLAFVGFLGLFLAANPDLYLNGFVRLLPPNRRARARDVLDQIGNTLRWWLLARGITMMLVGFLTWIGLFLLGVPLAFALALLAGLLDFVPNFGPIVAAIPAVLLGAVEKPMLGLYTALLYVGLQSVEAYVITPVAENKVVSLPPALILGAQVVLAVTAGVVGAALASPLLAVTIVLVRTLYLEDVLGEGQERHAADSGEDPEAA